MLRSRLSCAVTLLIFGAMAEVQWFSWKPECNCWVLPWRRTACKYYVRNMDREQCELLGCCYEEGGPSAQPRCFRPTGFCPPLKCQVSPSNRTPCSESGSTRETCFKSGCCFNEATNPRCYRSRDASKVDSYPYITGDQLFNRNNLNKDETNPKLINYGPNKLLFFCSKSSLARPCGKKTLTKNQCLRMGCCWNPTRKGECWKATYFLLSLPTVISSAHWSEWGSWSSCSTNDSCVSGMQRRVRICLKSNENSEKCNGSGSQTQTCGGCFSSWGNWGAYGACKSDEPSCLIGRKNAFRQCLSNSSQVLPAESCIGGKSASSKSKQCNKYRCSSFTAWSSAACSASCGGGTQLQARQCIKPPKGILFPQCLRRTVTCNTASCVSDRNLDLLLMLDSNYALDNCLSKSREIGRNFPFFYGDPILTSVNFPNFFQQNKFAKLLGSTICSKTKSLYFSSNYVSTYQIEIQSIRVVTMFTRQITLQQIKFIKLLSLWKDVTLTSTRVAIAQLSQNCNPMTSTGYHVKKYLDTEYNSAMSFESLKKLVDSDQRNVRIKNMLDSTSYFCEKDPSFAQFTCGMRVLARANRPNVPDVIIAFVPDVTFYEKQVRDFYHRNIHFISVLIYPATLFTISAANHSTMTKGASMQNELFCRQMACSSTIPTCERYLGTIYDDIHKVISKLRRSVLYL